LPSSVGVATSAVTRGLLFRVITTHLRLVDGVGPATLPDEVRRYARAADLLGV
jgi:hypothetical protein